MLDEYGRSPPLNDLTVDGYSEYFSLNDIFQGVLGDCFLIGSIMAITSNKELLSHVIPMDNISKENMNAGAYHFRLWQLGEWYDIVIDDRLPCNQKNQLFLFKIKLIKMNFGSL